MGSDVLLTRTFLVWSAGHRARHLPDRRAPRGGLRVREGDPHAGRGAAADGRAGRRHQHREGQRDSLLQPEGKPPEDEQGQQGLNKHRRYRLYTLLGVPSFARF